MMKGIACCFTFAALAASVAFAQDLPNANKVYVVRTSKPVRQDIAESMLKTGTIESPDVVGVVSKVTGRMRDMTLPGGRQLDVGEHVKAGDMIARLEDADYVAECNVARAAVSYAKVNVDDKRRERDRTKMLFDEKTSTEQEMDLAQAELERAEASLEQAKANLAVAEINLAETKILAPMDGVISAKSVSRGALVNAQSAICTVTSVDKLRLMLDVPVAILPRIDRGDTRVEVVVDAYPDEKLQLKVTNIHPVASKTTRTVRLEVEMDNSGGKYYPGMYATGRIAMRRMENVLVVPFESVLRTAKYNFLYVVKDGKAIATPVELGIRSDSVIQIMSGIGDEDLIVVAGQQRLANGVSVKEATE